MYSNRLSLILSRVLGKLQSQFFYLFYPDENGCFGAFPSYPYFNTASFQSRCFNMECLHMCIKYPHKFELQTPSLQLEKWKFESARPIQFAWSDLKTLPPALMLSGIAGTEFLWLSLLAVRAKNYGMSGPACTVWLLVIIPNLFTVTTITMVSLTGLGETAKCVKCPWCWPMGLL